MERGSGMGIVWYEVWKMSRIMVWERNYGNEFCGMGTELWE